MAWSQNAQLRGVFWCLQAHARLEPLPIRIYETEPRYRSPAELGSQFRDVVVGGLGICIQNLVATQRFEAGGLERRWNVSA